MEISEAASIKEGKKGTWRVKLIQPGWGSSGYYTPELLETYGPSTWPKGTQVYLDHPTVSEKLDRPERSIRDLGGSLVTTPVYEKGGEDGPGLYSDIKFLPHVEPIIEALFNIVGMSVRASGEGRVGEVEGKKGLIFESLMDGDSVDVVTKAGAGGKLIRLMESARNERKEEEKMGMVQIEEAEVTGLREKASKLSVTEAELSKIQKELEEAKEGLSKVTGERDTALREADKAAAQALISPHPFNDLEQAGLLAQMPLTEAGRLDSAKMKTMVEEALASRDASRGAGNPSGMGLPSKGVDGDWSAFDAKFIKKGN